MKTIQTASLGFIEGWEQGLRRDHSNVDGFKEVDWDIVKNYIEANKENIKSVEVGLAEDWDCTSGEVWNEENGYIKREDTYVYTCSSWATPSMEITFKNGGYETFESWKKGNDSDSYFEM